MCLDVAVDQAIGLGVDVPRPGRELGHEPLRHAGDRPRGVPVAAHLAGLPRDAEHPGQVVGEHGLVPLGEGHGRSVHRPSVQRAPLAVEDGLHLVADDDMGVQMRVTGPAVVVVVGGGDQPVNIDLCNRPVAARRTRARGRNLWLHERNHLRNRRVMRLPDQRLRARVRNRPQHARGLRNREREVITGDRSLHAALSFVGFDGSDRHAASRRTQLGVKAGDALRDPLRDGLVLGVGPAQWGSGDGVASHADQELELGFGDLIARRIAAHSPGARLDPPLLLALDEVGNLAPLPSLPTLMAEGGGTGITPMPVLQSLAQAREKWSENAAGAIWDASIVKIILGGASNSRDLHDLTTLIGERDEVTDSTTIGDHGSRSAQRSIRRVPIMPPDTIRTLPFGTALVLLRAAPPIVTRMRTWTSRPDAAQLRADRVAIEALLERRP